MRRKLVERAAEVVVYSALVFKQKSKGGRERRWNWGPNC
jgi:hypothetical protein